MAKENQGFRKDLNLKETINETQSLNILGGAGISEDLRILQNNLRNTSTLSFNTAVGAAVSSGYFYFGPISEFVYTDDDVVGVRTDITVGVGVTLYKDNTYYVCNSNTEDKFKLSTTPSSVGVNTITVSYTLSSFDFVRKEPVYKENILNLVQPVIQDTDTFNYFINSASINTTFDSVSQTNETAKYLITKKYKSNENTVSPNDINVEGSIKINDPQNFNTGTAQLSDPLSPGIFIGDTRAFSSDNNPWAQVGTALSTSSSSVSIGELYFANDITISGISAESTPSDEVTTYTHKLPVVINGETYYILLGA
jgi:hypothetical protein